MVERIGNPNFEGISEIIEISARAASLRRDLIGKRFFSLADVSQLIILRDIEVKGFARKSDYEGDLVEPELGMAWGATSKWELVSGKKASKTVSMGQDTRGCREWGWVDAM